jgi:RNA polymerase sigma-70 factor (ECF subfamily)
MRDEVIEKDRRGPVPALQPHRAMLARYLYVLGASPDRADDLVQEVFVFAIERGLEDRGPSAVAAFLRGVAKNLLLRERRSAAARREVELADEVWSEQLHEDERLDALRSCVGQLPQRSRDLLERCYVQGAGRIELGRAFGMLPNGVKTTLRRVRAALRACVERRLRGEA